MRYGATPEAWTHFADTLGLKVDLLPVVSNPHAKISERSNMKGLGKTPSYYNRDGEAIGFAGWTEHYATNGNLQHWREQGDYGICVQTRRVGAIDIDVEDAEKAGAIMLAIEALLGEELPKRYRDDSGKALLLFRRDYPMTKRVIPVDGGIIEFLGDGQQFVAVGTHPKGERYRWTTGEDGPRFIPSVQSADLEDLWQGLILDFATGKATIAREKRTPRGMATTYSPGDDPVADWLAENWETHDVGSEGQLFIECPFAGEHTTDNGPSSTAYFPAGTGGYQQGHFVCLHAHCSERSDHDFLDASGYNLGQFEPLDPPGAGTDRREHRGDEQGGSDAAERPALRSPDGEATAVQRLDPSPIGTSTREDLWPRMRRDSKGKIEAGPTNIIAAVEHGGMIGRHVAYDAFTDAMIWAPFDQPKEWATWRALGDADMTAIHAELEQRGFKPIGRQLLRDGVHAAAIANTMDAAQAWLARVAWDGVPRVATFAQDCWGWSDTPYSRAVSEYVWTALAGRVLLPGVQADMAPILVGAQGIRKTTAIKAMVPSEDMYAEIKLDQKDADQSRQLRGKLIGELEELRGLNSRAIEEIKAFISRRRESWVPKFKEFENFFPRRLLFVGSTNERRFLADPTGERRFLPGLSHFVDVERILRDRDQLWAEGAFMFEFGGVRWQKAEELAEAEHPQYKINDPWERRIVDYLQTEETDGSKPADRVVSIDELMDSALGLAVVHQTQAHAQRVTKALGHLGFRPVQGGWMR